MSRFSLPALACACALSFALTPAVAGDPAPAKKPDSVEKMLDALAQEFTVPEGTDINDVPLQELLATIGKRHGLNFVIDARRFAEYGSPDIREEKPKLGSTSPNGLTVRQFLGHVLDSLNATYLVRGGAVEIVPLQYAARVTRVSVDIEDSRIRFKEPLVSAVIKEKPLKEAVAKIAETYDLTVVVSPQAGDARTAAVSARLLNVPADKALELLALQADLRVVRRGAAYLITDKNQANEIFDEELNAKRQKIELEKLREAKPMPPLPGPGIAIPGDVPLGPLPGGAGKRAGPAK